MNLFAGMVITGYDFEKFYSAITSIFEIYFSKIFLFTGHMPCCLIKYSLYWSPLIQGKY